MPKIFVPVEDTERWKRQPTTERDLEQRCSENSRVNSTPETSLTLGPPARRSLKRARFVEFLYRRIGSPAVQIVLSDGTVIGDCVSSMGRVVLRIRADYVGCFSARRGDFVKATWQMIWMSKATWSRSSRELNRGVSRTRVMDGKQSSLNGLGLDIRWRLRKTTCIAITTSETTFIDYGSTRSSSIPVPDYEHPEATLSDAQSSKLDYVCRKPRLRPGDAVVEAGCGWGALALHMARNYGVTVRAFNLSHEQLAYARSRAKSEQLSKQIEFIEDDYRNITGKCDVFVSVGMLEHVGVENYRGLGQMVGRILTGNDAG